MRALGHGCWRVRVRFGFMDRPDVMRALERVRPARAGVRPDADLVLPRRASRWFRRRRGSARMARWRERMFAAMARNAGSVTDYFNIPTNRVIELGTQVEI